MSRGLAKLARMKTIHLLAVSLFAASVAACSTPPPVSSESAGPQPTSPPSATATTPGSATPTTAPGPTEPGDTLAAPYVLTFKQTGGIAAMNMETVIDSAAKRITYGGPRNNQPQSADLTADEVKGLTRVLQDAKLATFHAVKAGTVADAFSYSISVKTGGRDFVASWSDGSPGVPESYEAVRTAVTKLRDSKFSGKPAAGAPSK